MSDETPGAAELPSVDELRSLPQWGRVALAARCARRAAGLLLAAWPKRGAETDLRALRIGLWFAEESAASAEPVGDHRDAYRGANSAADSADARAHDSNRVAIASAAYAIVHAAKAAQEPADFLRAGKAIEAFRRAVEVYLVSTTAPQDVQVVVGHAARNVGRAVRRDLDLLKAAAERFNWTDDTPVPPEFFGPLWPEGEPEGWPEEAREERAPVRSFTLRVTGPEGTPPEEVAAQTREIIRLMEAVNRASGGRGLRIDDDTNVYDTVQMGSPTPVPDGGGA